VYGPISEGTKVMTASKKLALVTVALAFVGSVGCDETDDLFGDGGAVDGGSTPRDGGTTTGDAGGATKFVGLLLVDRDTDNVMCSATNGPGADIDAVELMTAGGVTVGFGMKGTASYAPGAAANQMIPCMDNQCAGGMCKYSDVALKDRVEGPRDGKVNATGDDVGYFSLNNGRLQLQVGDAQGVGPAREITSGMMVKVWEVDQIYKKNGWAPASCNCLAERFELWAVPTLGSAAGAVKLKSKMIEAENTAMCAAVGMTVGQDLGCGTTVFEIP
jgi:hypothetical protein